jgi:hypothetical protein
MCRLAFAAVLLLTATLGCGDRRNREVGGVSDTTAAPEVTTLPATEAEPGVRDFSFDQRQEFAQTVRQQLAGIDAEIEQLSAQAKSLGGAVSDRALERIRTARTAVDRDLRRVETATADNWDQVRSGVNRSVENLEEQIGVAQPK